MSLSWSISSREASPASQTQPQESDSGKTILAGYGLISQESFAWYDRDSSLWRTYQGCLVSTTDEPWEKFSGTWPRSGMTRSGESYRLRRLGRPRRESEYGSWPTPTARDWKDGSGIGTAPINNLLGRMVSPSAEAGALNPDWVECLMGLPVGWTDPDCDDPTPSPWPAGRVKDGPSPQYEWEPPRVAQGVKYRRQRISAIGDGQMPQVVEMIGLRLREWIEDGRL